MGADQLADFLGACRFGVLGGDHHRGRTNRLAVDVLQADLALRVGAEPGLAGVAGLSHRFQDVVRIIDRCRHQHIGLAHGVAEHDALVARAFVLVVLRIDALRDIGRLLMDVAFDIGMLPVEAFLLVADFADRAARTLDQDILGDRSGTADLTGENHTVRRRQRLDRDSGVRIGGEIDIDDRIGDPVANLIRMPFAYGLARENIICESQGQSLFGCCRRTRR